ncbi:FAD-dependent oxidoreductase [Dehalobacter sp. DCM]|uniref:FAD-dependent oxidoreductase n=1 Tax=Dehalobacter sp. DCM TaxID=2907827 RepID=UPI0030813DD5|nr:FAD-dependent oxidoreductase [Dehalobacter sp. DCM]
MVKRFTVLILALLMVFSLAGCGSNGNEKKSGSTGAAETKQADVVVVGSGMSGMSAAIEAASQGAKVILLEKQSILGGSTNFAEGMFASESSIQKQMGIKVNTQELLSEEFAFSNYRVDGNLWKDVMKNSGDNINWLLGMGVKFETVTSTGAGAKTWHVYEGFGKTVIDKHMKPQAEKLGVEIMTSTPAKELIMTNGQVTGVKATTADGKELDITAKAVILATGGFGNNPEMIKQLTHLDSSKYAMRGAAGHDGDGINMAKAAGALTGERAIVMTLGNTVDGTSLQSQLSVAAGQEPDLWVNQDGKRFCNEDVIWYYTRGCNAVTTQYKAFSVFDSDYVKKLATEGATVGWGMYCMPGTKLDKLSAELQRAIDNKNASVFKADTLEELAAKMGIDPATFKETVNSYNTMCAGGKDTDYGKDSKYLQPVKTGPFYAFNMKAINLTTCGGIRVNEKMEAVNNDYQPVKGLYAAGLDCDGFTGDTYGLTLPGSAQGLACYTGRNAAESAVAYAKSL